MTVATATPIRLEVACCPTFATSLYEQLSSGRYVECAVMPLPDTIEEWELANKTATKRVRRCLKRGYYATQFPLHEYADAIHEINVSKTHRQGRQMTAAYRNRKEFSPISPSTCDRHALRAWGVFSPARKLVAYMMLYRAGDLVLVSTIIGHGAYEKDEIMFLLYAIGMEHEIGNPGFMVYNTWDSGQDGLREFKRRLGFAPAEVEWRP